MKRMKTFLAVGSAVMLFMAAGAVFLFTRVVPVSASALASSSLSELFHGGGDRGESNTYLAQALGITTDELQTAQDAAYQKAVDQALADGQITQAQADRLKTGKSGRHGLFSGGFLVEEGSIDQDALLAAELGIDVSTLEKARTTASELATQAAIDSGELTQEQADAMTARKALKGIVDRDALAAQALGMTVEELQAAKDAGKTTQDLLTEKGMTTEQYQTALNTAWKAALDQAVKDGTITQAQADLLATESVSMGHGGMDMDGGMRGRGGHRGGGQGHVDGTSAESGAPALETAAPVN